jgi:uncharacterized membrane protein HdeD (DUF308 family)
MTARDAVSRLNAFVDRWWIFLVQGVVLLALAAFTFIRPALLLGFIAAYFVIEGGIRIFSGLRDRDDEQRRWLSLAIGVLSILAGLVVWVNPGFAAEAITYLVAIWGIVVGALLILWAIRLRQGMTEEWLLILFGALSILFGVLVFANVQAGWLTLQWIFGLYAIAGGILAIVIAFRIRGIRERLSAAAPR